MTLTATATADLSRSTPEILEPRRGQLGVADRVLDVLVTEVSLKRPRVVPLIRKRVSASMTQHMRVRFETQLGHCARSLDHAGEAGRREGRAALRT